MEKLFHLWGVVLEETEMEPFVSEVESIIKGKKIVLFGSYGWGDGQWMRDWEERMKSVGAIIIGGEGIIAHEMPGFIEAAGMVVLEVLDEETHLPPTEETERVQIIAKEQGK